MLKHVPTKRLAIAQANGQANHKANGQAFLHLNNRRAHEPTVMGRFRHRHSAAHQSSRPLRLAAPLNVREADRE